jgi:rSAM/selenodomain-associated transferase 1
MKSNLIIIFTRNPELGKVKTRLAKDIGTENALEIYKILLNHTFEIVANINTQKWIFYSENINEDELFDENFEKKLQKGNDLGEKMKNAFEEGFNAGFQKIVIIGSDLIDLENSDFKLAFESLDTNDVVIGPALDGGYYLLGLKENYHQIFNDKKWGTDTVLEDTLNDFKNQKVKLLNVKNDIDTIEDIKNIQIFKKYLKK